MPSRPRSHVIEAESKEALLNALPSSWIVRWESQDYGLDGYVELVESDGRVTGDVFAFQLKATDAAVTQPVRLSVEHVQYYIQHTLPVLLIHYHVRTKELRGCWVHSVTEAISISDRSKPSQKTVSITPTINVSCDNISQLAADLKKELDKRRHSPAVVIRVREAGESSALGEELVERITLETRAWCERLAPGRVVVTNRSQLAEPDLEVLVADAKAGINLQLESDGAGLDLVIGDLHWTGSAKKIPLWGTAAEPSEPQGVILIAAAFALYSRQDLQSGSILLKSGIASAMSIVAQRSTLAIAAAINLATAGREVDALQIADALARRGAAHAASMLATAPLFGNTTPDVREWQQRVLIACIEHDDDLESRSVYSYNLANSLRAASKYREAIHYYHRASLYSPHYRDMPYWWNELGGCLFLTSHYSWAANAYARARAIYSRRAKREDDRSYNKKKTLESLAKYGDALMFAGKYRQAHIALKKYVGKAKEADPEWALKYVALETLAELQIYAQRRRTPPKPLLSRIEDALDQQHWDEVERLINQAWAYDVLNFAAWQLEARRAAVLSQREQLVFASTMIALISPNSYNFAGALLNTLGTSTPNYVVFLIGSTGMRLFGTQMVADTHALMAEHQITPEGVRSVDALLRVLAPQSD